MPKLKGRLFYMGWFNLPWKLVTDDGEIDLWPILNRFLTSLNGKSVDHKRTRDSCTLSANEHSELRFKHIPGEYVFFDLDAVLGWLSGRLVEIEIEDGKQMKFAADASEEVFGVYFVGDGNSCEVPRGAEKTVCKAWQRECCIFLSAGTDGFHCEKFNGPMARILLDRLAKDSIVASRIGNCANLGRKEREAAAAV